MRKKNQKEIQTEMISRNTAATTIIKSKFLFFVLEGHIIQNGGAHKTSVLIQPIPFLCRQISSSKIVFDNLWTIYSTSGGGCRILSFRPTVKVWGNAFELLVSFELH